MKTFNYKNALGLLLIVAALSTACDNEVGLLASIQLETKENSNKIFVGAAVNGIVERGGKYYAYSAQIASRSTTSGSDWSVLESSVFGEDYYCSGLAATSTTLYAAIRSNQGSATLKGIYSSTDGSSWSAVDPAFASANNIQALYAVNDEVFAVVMNSSTSYDLVHLNAGSFNQTIISAADGFISPGAFDSNDYWFTGGTKLYYGSIFTSLFSSVSGASTPNGKTMTSVVASSLPSTIFVSTADRLVYKYDGASWTVSSALSSTSTEKISSLAYLPTSSKVIAGMDTATGYYELDPTSLAAVYCTSLSALAPENYSANPLSDKPVVKFSLLGNKLFACVAAGNSKASALWRNDWDGAAWSGWTAE